MFITVLKISATVLTVGSGYYFGKSLDEKLKAKALILNKISESIIYLKSKICGESYTIPDAMKETAVRFCDYKDSVFEKTSHYMLSDGMDSGEAWDAACKTCAECKMLGKDGQSVLLSAGSLLGCGDSDVQKENLDIFFTEVDKARKDAEFKAKKDGSLCIKLGLAGGCLLAILLW